MAEDSALMWSLFGDSGSEADGGTRDSTPGHAHGDGHVHGDHLDNGLCADASATASPQHDKRKRTRQAAASTATTSGAHTTHVDTRHITLLTPEMLAASAIDGSSSSSSSSSSSAEASGSHGQGVVRAWEEVGRMAVEGTGCPVCGLNSQLPCGVPCNRDVCVYACAAVPGLRYLPSCLTDDEQSCVMAKADKELLNTGRGCNQAMVFGLANFPPWVSQIVQRLEQGKGVVGQGAQRIEQGGKFKIFACDRPALNNRVPMFNQIIVNEYWPGEGIKPHVDLLKFARHPLRGLLKFARHPLRGLLKFARHL